VTATPDAPPMTERMVVLDAKLRELTGVGLRDFLSHRWERGDSWDDIALDLRHVLRDTPYGASGESLVQYALRLGVISERGQRRPTLRPRPRREMTDAMDIVDAALRVDGSTGLRDFLASRWDGGNRSGWNTIARELRQAVPGVDLELTRETVLQWADRLGIRKRPKGQARVRRGRRPAP
jgi:hypothetical protein